MFVLQSPKVGDVSYAHLKSSLRPPRSRSAVICSFTPHVALNKRHRVLGHGQTIHFHNWTSLKRAQHRLGPLEIGRIEALSEPFIDGCEPFIRGFTLAAVPQ